MAEYRIDSTCLVNHLPLEVKFFFQRPRELAAGGRLKATKLFRHVRLQRSRGSGSGLNLAAGLGRLVLT
jgi:hypothetical protein